MQPRSGAPFKISRRPCDAGRTCQAWPIWVCPNVRAIVRSYYQWLERFQCHCSVGENDHYTGVERDSERSGRRLLVVDFALALPPFSRRDRSLRSRSAPRKTWSCRAERDRARQSFALTVAKKTAGPRFARPRQKVKTTTGSRLRPRPRRSTRRGRARGTRAGRCPCTTGRTSAAPCCRRDRPSCHP